MVNPRATNDDLTAKARIRNAALDLYARSGEDRISLRAVAAEAGVTLGLVQHHFKTKAGLREAVDQLVVDYFENALRDIPEIDDHPASVAVRDEAVRRMLEENPTVVNYVRRALLEPSGQRIHLIDALVELTRREVSAQRNTGVASPQRRLSAQIVSVLARQMGELLLSPLVDAVWDRAAEPSDGKKPTLTIRVED